MSNSDGNLNEGSPGESNLAPAVVESSQFSLLDIVQEGVRNQNATRVNRMILVGEIMSTNEVQGFVNATSDNKGKVEGKMTGLAFIVNKATFIVVIEGSFLTLIEYLQGLVFRNSIEHFMSSARVLTSVEDVERMFPIWDLRLKRVPKAEQSDFSSEDLAQSAFETVKHFLLLGAALQGMTKSKCSEFLDSQKREVIGSIPTSELLSFYSNSSKLFPVEEYLDVFYNEPVKIDLEGERVFPIEPFLDY